MTRRARLVLWLLPVLSALGCHAPHAKAPPRDSATTCGRFANEVDALFSETAKLELASHLRLAAGKSAEGHIARVIATFEGIARSSALAQKTACEDAFVRHTTPATVYEKKAACARVVLASERALLQAIQNPSRETVWNLDDALDTIGVDATDCQKESAYAGFTPSQSDDPADDETAERAAGEARAYAALADQPRAKQAIAQGMAAAQRSEVPGLLVELLLPDPRAFDGPKGNATLVEQATLAKRIAERAAWPDGVRRSVRQLGLAAESRRDRAEALSWYEQEVALCEKLRDPSDRRTVIAYADVASANSALGKDAEALASQLKSVAAAERNAGSLAASTGGAYDSLGFILHHQGKDTEALARLRQAQDAWQRALGDDHPLVAHAFVGMAKVSQALGQHAEALESYRKALVIREEALGPHHLDTAQSHSDLAMEYFGQRQYEDARGHFEEALATQASILGKDHPTTANTQNNLGAACYELHEYDQATAALEAALSVFERAPDDQLERIAIITRNLAAISEDQQRDAAAVAWYDRSLTTWEKLPGKPSPRAENTRDALSGLCTRRGYAPACQMLKRHPER